jgi:hypothetical protein
VFWLGEAMKTKIFMLLALSGCVALAETAGRVLQTAIATGRQLELHGHEHAVAGDLPQDTPAEKSQSLNLPEWLEYGALFEVETAHSDGSTETVMATVEFGAGVQLGDWLHGDVVCLYEEGDTDPMELDQIYFTLGHIEKIPFYLQGGQFYAPFGHFDSYFISDPIVLELAENLEEGGTLGFTTGGFDAGLTIFESEIDGADDQNGIFAASYRLEGEDCSVAVGASVIKNILDADGLTGVLEDAEYTKADESAGLNAWLTATKDRATFIAEYVQVLEDFEIDGLKPTSVNLELGVALTDIIDVAAKYEHSSDIADWFAEKRYGAVVGCTLFEHDLATAGIAFEYLREEFDGGDDADLYTMQLALEF